MPSPLTSTAGAAGSPARWTRPFEAGLLRFRLCRSGFRAPARGWRERLRADAGAAAWAPVLRRALGLNRQALDRELGCAPKRLGRRGRRFCRCRRTLPPRRASRGAVGAAARLGALLRRGAWRRCASALDAGTARRPAGPWPALPRRAAARLRQEPQPSSWRRALCPPAMPSPLTGSRGCGGRRGGRRLRPQRRPSSAPAAWLRCQSLGRSRPGSRSWPRARPAAAASCLRRPRARRALPCSASRRGGCGAGRAASAAAPFSGSVTVTQVERPQQQLGHVEHLDLLPCRSPGDVVDAVGHHHAAERAAGGDLGGAGVHGLLDAFVVDALADVLFHPHPRAARAAAQTAVGVARHLGQRGAGGADQLARRVVDLVVPAQVARVVVGDVLAAPGDRRPASCRAPAGSAAGCGAAPCSWRRAACTRGPGC